MGVVRSTVLRVCVCVCVCVCECFVYVLRKALRVRCLCLYHSLLVYTYPASFDLTDSAFCFFFLSNSLTRRYTHTFLQHPDNIKPGSEQKVYAKIELRAVMKEVTGKTIKPRSTLQLEDTTDFVRGLYDMHSSPKAI